MKTRDYCKNCKEDTHCCVFKNNPGFTFVSINDAKRIKKAIKKDYKEFLDYSPLPKYIVKALKDCDPSLEGALRHGLIDNSRILRLKTIKKRCIFLDADNKCVIYSVRPNICRIYPYWAIRLENSKLKVINHGENPQCKVLKNNKKSDNKAILKVFNDIEKEAKDYKQKVKEFIKKEKL